MSERWYRVTRVEWTARQPNEVIRRYNVWARSPGDAADRVRAYRDSDAQTLIDSKYPCYRIQSLYAIPMHRAPKVPGLNSGVRLIRTID